MAAAKRVEFVDQGVDDAIRNLNDWMWRGIPEVIEDGLRGYTEDVVDGAYRKMKLPSTGRKDPLSVGLRYKRTRKSFWGPEKLRAEPDTLAVRVQPQYIAHWQEFGTKRHNLVGNANMKDRLERQILKQQEKTKKDIAKFHEYKAKGDKRGEKRVGKRVWEGYEKRDQLRARFMKADELAIVGYSADKPFRPGRGNRGSDWLVKNSRPATVKRGREFMHPGSKPEFYLAKTAAELMQDRSVKMAAKMTQVFEARKRGR